MKNLEEELKNINESRQWMDGVFTAGLLGLGYFGVKAITYNILGLENPEFVDYQQQIMSLFDSGMGLMAYLGLFGGGMASLCYRLDANATKEKISCLKKNE